MATTPIHAAVAAAVVAAYDLKEIFPPAQIRVTINDTKDGMQKLTPWLLNPACSYFSSLFCCLSHNWLFSFSLLKSGPLPLDRKGIQSMAPLHLNAINILGQVPSSPHNPVSLYCYPYLCYPYPLLRLPVLALLPPLPLSQPFC